MSRRKHRSPEARRLHDAVIAAGGTVERTKGGHLKVLGPAGIAIVQSAPGTTRQSGRSWHNAVGFIRRHAGLDIDP